MNVIVNASLSRILFSNWPPVAVSILYFPVHVIDGWGEGYRRNTLLPYLSMYHDVYVLFLSCVPAWRLI